MTRSSFFKQFLLVFIAFSASQYTVNGNCVDIAGNCGVNVGLCNDPHFLTLMQSKCAATCRFCTPGGPVQPGQPGNLLQSTVDDFVLVAHGDTQYYEPCINTNVNCKAASKSYRDFYGVNDDCYVTRAGVSNEDMQKIHWECEKIEGTYANNVQFASINNLFNTMRAVHQPRILTFAGDLTNVGRQEELDAFTNQWLTLDAHMAIGLGNHDYENNVGKCQQDHCADRMLNWMVSYGIKHGLKLDYTAGTVNGKPSYFGSFSYAKKLCTHSGKQCSVILQLHNRIDYEKTIDGKTAYWKVKNSVEWLRGQLISAMNEGLNVFIVCHHLGSDWTIIPNMIKSLGMRNRIFVLYAHAHAKQEIKETCSGIQVPFIYVGSVPNNRFTAIKLSAGSPNDAEIFLMSANAGGSYSVLQQHRATFAQC